MMEIPTYRELADRLEAEERRNIRLARKVSRLERQLQRVRIIEATKAQFDNESG